MRRAHRLNTAKTTHKYIQEHSKSKKGNQVNEYQIVVNTIENTKRKSAQTERRHDKGQRWFLMSFKILKIRPQNWPIEP